MNQIKNKGRMIRLRRCHPGCMGAIDMKTLSTTIKTETNSKIISTFVSKSRTALKGRYTEENRKKKAKALRRVALHLTVVDLTCNKNGGPDILLLACFYTKPGGPSWTPQPYSAPMSTALPEAKLARATLVSIRGRSSASSVTRATKPSAPAEVRSSIACAPRQRPWCSG